MMGWNSEPPTNPPEDNRVDCGECDGSGLLHVDTCYECHGEGLVELDEDAGQPDTWKEAYGWA